MVEFKPFETDGQISTMRPLTEPNCWSITFKTQELTDEGKLTLINDKGAAGRIIFAPDEVEEKAEKISSVGDIKFFKNKTDRQEVRDTMYVYFLKSGKKKEYLKNGKKFEDWYKPNSEEQEHRAAMALKQHWLDKINGLEI